MSRNRHNYVPFYMDDWKGGTIGMPGPMRLIYLDICIYIWDKAQPVPEVQLSMIVADMGEAGQNIVQALIDMGKLERDERGVFQKRALHEAEKAFALWQAKSDGGRARMANKDTSKTPAKTRKETQIQTQRKKEEANASSQESGAAAPTGDDADAGSPPAATAEAAQPDFELVADNPPAPGPEAVVDAWNAMARANGFSQVAKMTGERGKRLNARIAEHTAQGLIDAIATIPDSPFIMAGWSSGGKAGFDWLLQPESCAKLIEGFYHGTGSGKQSGWTA